MVSADLDGKSCEIYVRIYRIGIMEENAQTSIPCGTLLFLVSFFSPVPNTSPLVFVGIICLRLTNGETPDTF